MINRLNFERRSLTKLDEDERQTYYLTPWTYTPLLWDIDSYLANKYRSLAHNEGRAFLQEILVWLQSYQVYYNIEVL
jgi:hypothetical protein